ncbi:hypothetical protein [Streptomyces albus]|nr:hypothetical protein [Streptomyces albus]
MDWARVEAAAPGDRDDLLSDAAFDEDWDNDRVGHRWSRPARPG